jgi:hypothetical protein
VLEGEATVSLQMASIRRRIGARLIQLGYPEQALLPLEFALSVIRLRLPENVPDQAEIRAELAQAQARSGNLERAKILLAQIKDPAAMSSSARERYAQTLALITSGKP